MSEILKLNEISPAAVSVFGASYKLSADAKNPKAIILRSYSMHDYALPDSVMCVARAGAGVNNIPVDEYTKKGVVVFNTPGANANAVKELVIAALMLSSRQIVPAIKWAESLKGKGAEVQKLVEKGKNAFVGREIQGKTIGIVGLGAIGALVANSCITLGMDVIGFDPYISIDSAWSLSRHIKKSTDLNRLYAECDYISLHVPLKDATKHMINSEAISKMRDGVCIINCSRAELVNSADMIDALSKKKIDRYVTDFPTDELLGVENVVAIPHLGASTPEAEDNCAIMAARQLVDFIENGNITNSVNFPACSLAHTDKCRLTIIHKNIPSMLTKITDCISATKTNISNLLSQSKNEYAYTILELDDMLDDKTQNAITAIDGIIKIRKI